MLYMNEMGLSLTLFTRSKNARPPTDYDLVLSGQVNFVLTRLCQSFGAISSARLCEGIKDADRAGECDGMRIIFEEKKGGESQENIFIKSSAIRRVERAVGVGWTDWSGDHRSRADGRETCS